jgi:hypothetical protein
MPTALLSNSQDRRKAGTPARNTGTPETVRADVREQSRFVRLPASVILFSRLLRWRS